MFLNPTKVFSSQEFVKGINFIKKNNLIKKNDNILISFSGGADSVYLLNFLLALKSEYNLSLGIAYFNHKLRPEAASEEKQINKYFKNKKIKVFTAQALDLKSKKLNLQESARIYRYNFLLTVAKKNCFDKVALGHNANDITETLFINLFRGSGIDGLSGIKEKFVLKKVVFIRPLLEVPKKDILSFLRKNKIAFLEDKSNFKDIYLRNKIRNKLIPYLKNNFAPQIENSISNSTQALKLQKFVLDYFLENSLQSVVKKITRDDFVLDLEKLNKYPAKIKINIIRKAIINLLNKKKENSFLNPENYFGDNSLSFKHLANLNKWLESPKNKSGNFFQLPSIFIYKDVNELSISVKKRKEITSNLVKYPLKLQVPGKYKLKNNLYICLKIITNKNNLSFSKNENKTIAYFNAEKIEKILYIRTRKQKDYFYPLGMKNKVKLKNYFINNKVPKNLRNKIFLLVNKNNDIIWIINYRIDERYKVLKKENKKILKVSLEGEIF